MSAESEEFKMKRLKNHLMFVAVFLLLASIKLNAQFSAGISMGRGGLNGFYMNLGNYFRVPQREIIVVRDRRLPDEEIPVVFFVARKAGVSPRAVARMRRQGYSWMDITYNFGLSPAIFFPGRVFQGPPYGKAWGYNRNRGRNCDNVSDYDIINAVNSRIIAESYNCCQDDVIRMRNQGRGYVQINDMYYGKKYGNNDNYGYHGSDRWDDEDRDRD